jgi:hypothetical protein
MTKTMENPVFIMQGADTAAIMWYLTEEHVQDTDRKKPGPGPWK